ncbi:HD domain-containing protein [Paenibacillus sp. RC67]|uniref:HD domain-containing protein n=1 Tax=Paenibacillus sp. RC67 TaxID=3039392 RepID=UPI0024AD0AA2|nr:HD domain-containing protein [Paenibacillus sp. RC67]
MNISPEPFETELFQSAPLRRLKHLHHFGAGALFSPVTHSRYEHTIGIWALIRHFFPDHRELRAAAILHDIGHLPFSHTVEHALGISHHQKTEEAIGTPPVSAILTKYGLSPQRIIKLLNTDSPLTHKSDWLGVDHLDSFLRDTYMAGLYKLHPADIVRRIHFKGNNVEAADEETALHLLDAVVKDNLVFLHPHFLVMDDLMSRAVDSYCREYPDRKTAISHMTDSELLSLLQAYADTRSEIKALLQVLLSEPHRIELSSEASPDFRQVSIRKIYVKQPLVDGAPLSSISSYASEALRQLEALPRTYYYKIRT